MTPHRPAAAPLPDRRDPARANYSPQADEDAAEAAWLAAWQAAHPDGDGTAWLWLVCAICALLTVWAVWLWAVTP